jgi:hypothetical protein
MSNLRLINETSVSSSVAKVRIENVFTSDYDIYKIVYDKFFADGQDLINLSFLTPQGIEERLYYAYSWAFLNCQTNASFSQGRDNQDDDIQGISVIGSSTGESAGGVLYIFNPFSSSSYTFVTSQNSAMRGSVNQNKKGIGSLNLANSMGGFAFSINGTDSFTSGVIKTFGIRVDV